MKISVDILSKPMVLVTRGGPELQTFRRVVSLAWAMIHIAKVALDATSGADALGQTLGVNQVI